MNFRKNQCSTHSMPSSSWDRKKHSSVRRLEKVKISVSYPSSEHIVSPSMSNSSSIQASMISSSSKEPIAYKHSNDFSSFREHSSQQHHANNNNKQQSNQQGSQRNNDYSPNSTKKHGKRNIKIQVKKFKMETKAAKTLAIIVGLFICCWLPFFTMYLVRPFCDNCINPVLFSVVFWIGYCNSAINPMIYALFSKDFRIGFKRVIYRCFCSKKYFEENKFYVLHRFVPFPFVPQQPNSNNVVNMDLFR